MARGERLDDLGWIGATIAGKFRVERVVGEGGFGIVYAARHMTLGVPVVVKCLKMDGLPADRRELFLRSFQAEGRIMLNLSRASASIVGVMDMDAAESPRGVWTPYLVLEWVEGTSLADDLDARERRGQGARTLPEALDLLEPVAQAIQVAHDQGIAHRDLKPANMMLTEIGGRPTMKVLDFGVAKIVDDAARGPCGARTGSGLRAFTLAYGTPEQLAPSYGATGPWTDVYALALVLVEVVSGRRPYGSDHPDVIATRVLDLATRPTPRRHGVACSDEIDRVFSRALAVDPRHRHPTAGAFWSALRAAVPATAARLSSPRTAAPATVPDSRTSARSPAATVPGVEPLRAPTPTVVSAKRDLAPVAVHTVKGGMIPPGGAPGKGARASAMVFAGVAVASLSLAGATAFAVWYVGSGERARGAAPDGGSLLGRASTAPVGIAAATASIAAGRASVAADGAAASKAIPVVSVSALPTARPPRPPITDRPQFVRITGGTFSPWLDGGPGAPAAVADFELGITEVTQRQFAAFVAATRRTEPGEYCWVRAPIGQPQPPGRWQFPGADPDEPVVCVTQEEAESYAAWLGETTGRRVRLPTSAEWEYAARGGGRPIAYPWGNAWPPPPGAANIADRSVKNATYGDAEALPLTDYDDGARYSMPVASTSPNELGLYDMSGNVWERVGDHADPCIVRGGSWDNASPVLLSTSGKELVGCNKPRTAAMGFRVARDVTR